MDQQPQTHSANFLLFRLTWSPAAKQIQVSAGGRLAVLFASLLAMAAIWLAVQ